MKKIFFVLILSIFMTSNLYASQSTITESEGYACMGDDKSRKETEQAAMTDAKKRAIEFVSSYVTTESHVKNFQLDSIGISFLSTW